MSKKVNILIILWIATIGKTFNILASTLLFVGGLTVFSAKLNLLVFRQKDITSFDDKIQLVKTLGLWLSLFLFSIASCIMFFRLSTGKSLPSPNTDPLLINTLNRVITNTIEQTVIFAGLYAPILFNDKTIGVGGKQVLALASLFVIGRATYGVGYFLGSITKIPTFRSFGFALGLFVNVTLISYHFGINVFQLLETHGAPIIRNVLA